MIRFLIISTWLLLPSILGRTPFISALNPYLKKNLGLSEALFSFAYSLGTFMASLGVPLVICCLGQNFCLKRSFRIAYGTFIASFIGVFLTIKLSCPVFVKFIFLVSIYGGFRLSGQGLLPTLTRTYAASLFDDKCCAWIGMVHTTVIVGCASAILYILARWDAFEQWHWVICVQVMLLVCWLLFLPKNLPRVTSMKIHSLKRFRFVLKDFPLPFKIGLGIIAFQNLQSTAVAFHLSDFAREQQIPLSTIFKVFLPISLSELILNPLMAWLYNHSKKYTLFYSVLLNLMLFNFSITHLDTLWGMTTFIFACALVWSCNHILSYSFPARILSVEQRAIGYATFAGWVSFCSAMGPFVYSSLAHFFGCYGAVSQILLYINGFVLLSVICLVM